MTTDMLTDALLSTRNIGARIDSSCSDKNEAPKITAEWNAITLTALTCTHGLLLMDND